MSIVIALVTGIFIAWASRIESGTDGRTELIMNVIIGSVGAYLGGWILTAVFHPAYPGSLSLGAIAASIFGATTALVVVNRIRET